MNRIYLRDHSKTVFNNVPSETSTEWEKALKAVGFSLEGVQKDYLPNDPPATMRGADALIILHTDQPRATWEAGFAEGSVFAGHLIIVSTRGGAHLTPSSEAKVHVCYWSPEHFSEAAPSRLKKWVSQVNTDSLKDVDWSLLHPVSTDNHRALHLLCEAWELNRGINEMEHGGVKIKAPVTAEEWFSPFNKKPSKEAAEEIANEIYSSATKERLVDFLYEVARTQKATSENRANTLKSFLETNVANIKHLLADEIAILNA